MDGWINGRMYACMAMCIRGCANMWWGKGVLLWIYSNTKVSMIVHSTSSVSTFIHT